MLSKNDYVTRRNAASHPPAPTPQVTPPPSAQKRLPSVAAPSPITSKDIRGLRSTTIVAPTKNVATDRGQLSLPLAQVDEAMKERHPRNGSDVTRHAADALATCHGDIFKKENCSTSKGWSRGQFV